MSETDQNRMMDLHERWFDLTDDEREELRELERRAYNELQDRVMAALEAELGEDGP